MSQPERNCVHCGVRVELVNAFNGPQWHHIPSYREFGSEYRQCKNAPYAEPAPLPDFVAPAPVNIPSTQLVWPCGVEGNSGLAHESGPCDGRHAPVEIGRSIHRSGMVRLPGT